MDIEPASTTKCCSKCQKIKPLSEFYKGKGYRDGYRGQCKECMYSYYVETRLNTGKQARMFRKSYEKKGDEYNKVNTALKKRKRLRVLKHYGGNPPKCACCGETITDFLTIDHIKEDGAKHRKKGIYRIANWLIKNNFPKGFQVLCWNCNWGRRVNNGICVHKNPPKIEELLEKPHKKQRMEILTHYSGNPPKCSCCGESNFEFLTLDHIENDGAEQRKKFNLYGSKMYSWIINNDFPDGFQVLCWNCNAGKRMNNGVCPHQSLSKKISNN